MDYGAVQAAIQYHFESVESHSNPIQDFLLTVVVVSNTQAPDAN